MCMHVCWYVHATGVCISSTFFSCISMYGCIYACVDHLDTYTYVCMYVCENRNNKIQKVV